MVNEVQGAVESDVDVGRLILRFVQAREASKTADNGRDTFASGSNESGVVFEDLNGLLIRLAGFELVGCRALLTELGEWEEGEDVGQSGDARQPPVAARRRPLSWL